MVAQPQQRETLATRLFPNGVRGVLQLPEASITLVAIIIAVIFQSINAGFLTGLLPTLLKDAAQYGLLAIGEAMLMITGEIDLSVPKIYSTAPFVVLFASGFLPFPLAVLVGLAVGALIGMVNGIITVKFGVPSLITTLGMQFLLDGIVLTVVNSNPIATPINDPYAGWLGNGINSTDFSLAQIANFLWLIAAVIVLTLVLRRTRFGLHTISVGSNLLASREIGIRTDLVKIVNFMIAGVTAGFAGILFWGGQGSVNPSAGDPSLALYGIAAAVIGGTSLFGGYGTIIGALIGALVIAALRDGLPLVGAPATVSFIILGIAIVVSMVLNIRFSKSRGRR